MSVLYPDLFLYDSITACFTEWGGGIGFPFLSHLAMMADLLYFLKGSRKGAGKKPTIALAILFMVSIILWIILNCRLFFLSAQMICGGKLFKKNRRTNESGNYFYNPVVIEPSMTAHETSLK